MHSWSKLVTECKIYTGILTIQTCRGYNRLWTVIHKEDKTACPPLTGIPSRKRRIRLLEGIELIPPSTTEDPWVELRKLSHRKGTYSLG